MKLKQLFLFVVPFLMLTACSNANDDHPTSSGSDGEPPAGEHTHTFEGSWQKDPRDHWKVCDDPTCNEVGLKARHEFEVVSVDGQTCSHPEHTTYRCKTCGYEKEVDGHDLNPHSYKKSVKKAATCQEAGTYLFKCDVCGDEYEQSFTAPNAHHIVVKSKVSDVITYQCDNIGCTHEYQVIDAKSYESTEVNNASLKEVGAVELKDAAIAFDQTTLDSFNENVTISAEPKTADELGVSDELKEVIGDNKIIDFSIKDGEEDISYFTGSVTVTIPYELKEGENPEGIVVWYLQDGEPTPMEASYHDGFVSFETTHFSLYTVVHLTPEEVCKSFGHNMSKAKSVLSTCVKHGYTDHICSRCSFSERETLPLINHNYEFKTKVDATHTSEGYLEYECSVCHDKYHSVIEKIPATQQGFYLTLAKSFLNSDIAFTGIEKFAGTESTIEGYKGLDLEGLPFTYIRIPIGDRVQEVGQYKGYNLNGDFTRNKGDKQFTTIFANIGEIFAKLPGSVDDLAQKFGENHLERFFTKTTAPEGFSFSLNKDKIDSIFTTIKTGTAGDLLEEIMGEGGYDWLVEWITKAYDKTLQQVFDELGQKGYVVRELYDAFVDISNIINPDREEPFKTFDEITDGKLSKSIIEIVSESYPDYAEMIPPTADDAKAMLDVYLAMPAMGLIDMASAMGGMGGSTVHHDSGMGPMMMRGIEKEEAKEEASMLDMYEALIKGVELSFTTASNGEFASLFFSLNDEEGVMTQGQPMSMSIQMKKGFDKYAICERLDQYNDYSAKREGLYDLNSGHYDWFVKPYKEKYNIDFDYVSSYETYPSMGGDVVYDALISKQDVVTISVWDDTQEKVVDVKGKLCFRFMQPRNDDNNIGKYYYYISKGNMVQNVSGLGSVLAKGAYGVEISTYDKIESIFVKFTNPAGAVENRDLSSSSTAVRPYKFDYLYDLEKDKLNYTDGSYEYLTEHNYRYDFVSREEFFDNTSYRDAGFEGDDYIFFKKTCEDCGYVEYDYRWQYITRFETNIYIGSRYFISDKMNDEALEHVHDVARMKAYYTTGGKIQYRVDESEFQAVYDYYAGTSHRTTDGIKFGNAELRLIKTNVGECRNNFKVILQVGDYVLHTQTYQLHKDPQESPSDFVTNHYKTAIDPCHDEYIYTKKCKDCGREFYYDRYVESHHTDLEVLYHADATNTAYGYTLSKCNACGEHVFDHHFPLCNHDEYHFEEREDVSWFVCDMCGYEIEASERPVIYFDEIEAGKPGYVLGARSFTFSLVGYHYGEAVYCFGYDGIHSSDYSAQMVICYVDDGGDVVIYQDGQAHVSATLTDYSYILIEEENRGYDFPIWNNIMRFDSTAAGALMSAAQNEEFGSGHDLYYAIMVTYNYSGQQREEEFVIPVFITVLS